MLFSLGLRYAVLVRVIDVAREGGLGAEGVRVVGDGILATNGFLGMRLGRGLQNMRRGRRLRWGMLCDENDIGLGGLRLYNQGFPNIFGLVGHE